jgi:hypothetical protein
MVGVSPSEVLSLVARLAFAAALYVFVLVVLFSLRRSLRTAPAAGITIPRARLTLAEAPPADGPIGRVVPLDRPLLIGRRPDCDIVLRDDAVSGHHARVAWDGDAWQVEDLLSTNGTFLNGDRVHAPVPLHAGDAVRIGNTTWRLELQA